MASGLRALRKILVGKEANDARGTAVTPTAFLVGTLGFRENLELFMPDEYETGRLASYERSQIIAKEASLPFEADANYEQLQYLLEMAIKQTSTGNGRATASGRTTWTYAPSYTGSNNPSSFTFEYGDDVGQFRSTYVSCRNLELSGQVGDVVKVNADLFGRAVEKLNAFSASNVAPPDRESIKMGNSELYIDDTWAAVGTTKKVSTLIDFSYKFATGFNPMRYSDNRLDFSDITEAKRHVELEMTVGFNTDAIALFDAFLAQTQKVVELRFTGSNIGSNPKTLKLQAGGNVTEFEPLGEREGQDIVKMKLVSIYDDTAGVAKDMGVILQNGTNTV